MSPRERRGVDLVEQRLVAELGDAVPRRDIEHAVDTALAHLAPVQQRQHVPQLVEEAVRAELADRTRGRHGTG
jgi:hypothetical protein